MVSTTQLILSGLFVGILLGGSITLIIWWVKERLLRKKVLKEKKEKEDKNAKEEIIREIKREVRDFRGGYPDGGRREADGYEGTPGIVAPVNTREQCVEPEVIIDERDRVQIPKPVDEPRGEQPLEEPSKTIELHKPEPL